MLSITVSIDGNPVPVDTPEQFDNFVNFVRYYRQYVNSTTAMVVAEKAQPSPHITEVATTSPPIEDDALHNEDPLTTPIRVHSSWTERAWLSLNKQPDGSYAKTPRSGEDIYNKARSMGYVSRAENPLGAFKRSIRDNPIFFRAGENNNKATLWGMNIETGVQVSEEISVQRNPPPTFPPKGKQTADYAEQVLRESQSGLNLDDLVAGMLKTEWHNRSATPAGRKRSVEVRLYKDKTRFSRSANGVWSLNGYHPKEGSKQSDNAPLDESGYSSRLDFDSQGAS